MFRQAARPRRGPRRAQSDQAPRAAPRPPAPATADHSEPSPSQGRVSAVCHWQRRLPSCANSEAILLGAKRDSTDSTSTRSNPPSNEASGATSSGTPAPRNSRGCNSQRIPLRPPGPPGRDLDAHQRRRVLAFDQHCNRLAHEPEIAWPCRLIRGIAAAGECERGRSAQGLTRQLREFRNRVPASFRRRATNKPPRPRQPLDRSVGWRASRRAARSRAELVDSRGRFAGLLEERG